MSWVLGVDLGTSYSAAGAVDQGRVSTLSLGAHGSSVPSAVYVGDGSLTIGESAVALGAARPERLLVEFKRQIGEDNPLLAGDRFITAEELQSELGQWVYGRACELQGSEPERTVFTCPAFWGGYRRERFQALVADMTSSASPSEVVTEPEAAAVYYASRDRLPTGTVVGVYDLGGGTFDATILSKHDAGFELLGRPAGDPDLGGIDLDRALLEHVIELCGVSWSNLDRDDPQVVRGLAQLRQAVTLGKELLSAQLETEIGVALPSATTTIRVTRRELEALAAPMVERTVTVFADALQLASVAPKDLHSILLVGGGSRMPLVAETLTERFSVPLALDSHPKFAVCMGAAIVAEGPAGAAVKGGFAPPQLPPPTGLPAPEGSPAPVSGGGRRVVVAAIGAVAVAIAALAAFLVLGRSGSSGPAIPRAASPLPASVLLFSHYDSNTQQWSIDSTPADGSASPTEIVNVPSARSWLVALSPDRRSLVYTEEHGNARSLVVADTEGKQHLTVATDVAEQARATWAPAGDRLAYMADRNGVQQLVMLDLVKHTTTDLTNDSVAKGDPAWSPKGRSIALWRDVDQNIDIYLVDPSAPNSPPQRVTTDPGADEDPAWSPDGSQLAFDRQEASGQLVLWVRDVASGAEHRLVDTSANDMVPSYSPDSSAIAFESSRTPGGVPDGSTARVLWAVGADGTNVRQVTKPTSPAQIDVHAAWTSPSG